MPKLGVFSYLCKFFAKQITKLHTIARQMKNIISDGAVVCIICVKFVEQSFLLLWKGV